MHVMIISLFMIISLWYWFTLFVLAAVLRCLSLRNVSCFFLLVVGSVHPKFQFREWSLYNCHEIARILEHNFLLFLFAVLMFWKMCRAQMAVQESFHNWGSKFLLFLFLLRFILVNGAGVWHIASFVSFRSRKLEHFKYCAARGFGIALKLLLELPKPTKQMESHRPATYKQILSAERKPQCCAIRDARRLF